MSALVLVVDDTELNLLLLEARLSAEYFSVLRATSGEQAVDLALRWKPDVVLLDAVMPGVDGFDVCRHLRGHSQTRHLPVIMITAHDGISRLRGLRCGADDFLIKPVSEAVLLARIDSLVRFKRELDELRSREELGRRTGLLRGMATFEDTLVLEKGRVLVFEDRSFLLEFIVSTLGVEFHVDVATDQETFWEALHQSTYDVFVVSLSLQKWDGLRVCSWLRQEERLRHVPIIVVLDAACDERLVRALRIGVNDYLFRPVNACELKLRCGAQLKYGRYRSYLHRALTYGIESAAVDVMTRFHNRRYMLSYLETLCSEDTEPGRRKSGETAVLLFDLDFFKVVNDEWGHNVGDAVLQQFAACIYSGAPPDSVLGRWGGEEFLLVVVGGSTEKVIDLAEDLRRKVALFPFSVMEGRIVVHVTTSVGLTFLNAGDRPEDLLLRSDSALYQAKRQGRNRVVVRHPGQALTPPRETTLGSASGIPTHSCFSRF